MDHRRPPLRQRLGDWFDLPRDIFLDLPRISVVGDLQVLVENHRGLLQYDAGRVTIGMSEGRLVIRGAELGIGVVNPEAMIVTGRLSAIEFHR